MKKRILSLFLALVTVFYILPIGSIPAIATEEYAEDEGISIEDMEVGKLYSAKFYADTVTPLVRFAFEDTKELGAYPYLTELPQTLTVVREGGNSFDLVYVSDYVVENEIEWPEAYASYRYVSANDLTIGDGISLDQMEIGKEYTATWSTDASFVLVYKRLAESASDYFVDYSYGKNDEEYEFSVNDGFPEELIVERVYSDDLYEVRVTNDNWPAKFEDYRYLNYLDIIITGEYTPPADDGYIYGKVGIFCEDAVDGTLTLEKGEKVQAFTELDAEISENAKYQWQMKLEDDRWAIITDCFYSWINISEALITNAKCENATLRCAVTDGTKKYASEELKVAMEPEINAVYAGANGAGSFTEGLKGTNTLNADSEAYQAQIEYFFVHTNGDINDKPAANPFVHTFQDAEHKLSATISSPYIEGYTACVPDENGTIEYNEKKYTAKPSHSFNNVGIGSSESELLIKIFYVPNLVSYTVEYYEQNLTDDSYRRAGQERKYGYTDDTVADDLAVAREGFKSRYYDDTLTIAGNEDTVVEIYYDRIYYLVDFDLDGGYGTTPYYVRYGTSVMLTKPTRSGYTFNDPWIISSVDGKTIDEWRVDDSELADTYSSSYAGKNANALIVVKNNLKYTASWSKTSTKYSIVYWLEDADSEDSTDPGNYHVWYTVTRDASTENTTDVAVGDHIKTYILNAYGQTSSQYADVDSTYPYLTYMDKMEKTLDDGSKETVSETGQTKTVAGDGSTSIDVYYSRKEYTLKFYYAISTGEGEGATWYVIGGSTYYATTYNIQWNDDRDNILQMLEKYVPGGSAHSQAGLSTKPTLNTKGDSRNYDEGSDKYTTSSDYNHHYISFTAKYGADISNLWPCDVFNSVTNNEKSTNNNGWAGTAAYVSAWNGEWRVKYTQEHTGNQTIKGNYTQLDANLLWKDTSEEDTTVSYICFWENGAENINWNYPKLYRYKIWLPTLPGVTYTQDTYTDANGVTYYLADYYDTCDDSMVGGQTQPAIVGFDMNGSISYHVASADSTVATKDDSRITDADTTYIGGTEESKNKEIAEISAKVSGDNPTYTAAAIMNYFYTRINYTLSYDDNYGTSDPVTVPYGTSLNSETYKKEGGPTYPSALEPGERKFVGWFMDEACQHLFEFETTDADGNKIATTMPAKNIQLYAKWETTKHDVKVYRQESEIGSTESGKLLLDKSGENAVDFGTQISEPENNTYTAPADNYIFDGWYYKVDGEEKRYDFNTMVIKQETVIYAKWAKNVQVAYSVEYVTNTGTPENPEYVNIGKTETGYSLAGIPKTFTAKMGSELYEGYTEWYFPNERYITHVMTESSDTNKIVFEYHTTEEISYTINHIFVSQKFVEQIGVEEFTYSKTFTMTKNPTGDEEGFKATIVERFNDLVKPDLIKAEATLQNATDPEAVWTIISGMTPDYLVQELDLTFNSDDNVITFKWTEAENVRNYQIIHYLQNKDLTTYDTYISQTYTVANDPSLVIKALWDDPFGFTRKEFKINGSVQANSTDSDEMSVILGDSGNLILEFYYDRAYFTYTVHHYITGTTTKAADTPDDIYDGSTTDLKKAFYEEEIKISKVAHNLESKGYYLHNGSTVRVINDDNLELICFYNPAEVQFLFQEQIPGRGQLTGDGYPVYVGHVGEDPNASVTATANDGYRFVGWIMDGGLSIDTYATVVGSTITPNKPTAEMANKTYTFFAVFEPTTKVFKNTGVADANQAFIYRIHGLDDDNNNVDVTFVITGNGQITLAMLPYGNYEITVLSWAWRYGLPNSQTQATWRVEINSTADFVFAYSGTPTDQWLTDDASGTVTP